MIADVIQKDRIKEQKLQFIRNHQQAFDVEPIYPLPLFEDFVTSIKGDCDLEASCKIESDKLIASRFLLFFKDKAQEWQKYLHQSLTFFSQVENRVGVQIDYSLLHQFLGSNFDFSKVGTFTTGIDLRKNLADSSLKIHFRIEDYLEKLETSLALSGDSISSLIKELPSYPLTKLIPQIGFDFYFNGSSEIELYLEVGEDNFQHSEIKKFLWRRFSTMALEPLKASSMFHLGLSKANNAPVLYYHLKNKKDLVNYFNLNDMGQRVHGFYQHQDVGAVMWVGTAQKELEKTRIENIRLYYYKSFKTE
jgi:LynF/TruF/PatF family peptide O-prenyltransferase